jgi:hypothetical protein
MTPTSEQMLLREVAPRLRNGLRQTSYVGSDDESELLQDGLVIAIHLLHSAERTHRSVTPGNIAFYTLKLLRSGRRSTGCHKTDPLHPAAQISGRCRVHSLEEPVANDESSDEPLTLGEVLESRAEDPATEAARRLDWQRMVDRLDDVAKAVLQCLADGQELTILVRRLGRSRSALQNDKNRLAERIRECLGVDILARVQDRPGWRDGIQASLERQACRWERRVA